VSRRGWLLFLTLCLVWGFPYLLIRVAVRDLSPQTLLFFRAVLAAAVLTPFALYRGGLRRVLARWPWLLAFTILEMSLPWFLLAQAEQRISSSLTGLLIGAMPLIAVALYRAFGESYRFDTRHVAGLAAGFAGVAALVGIDVGHSDLLGAIEVLTVAVCWAAAPIVLIKRLAGLSAVSIAAATLLFNAVAFAPAAALSWPSSVSPETAIAVVGLAVVCTALAFLVYFALIGEMGPSRSAMITYVNPLVAVLLGVVVLGEPLTLGIMLGTPLILIGSVLATAPSLRKPGDGRPLR
jgi:drug/metabolite transporter (DMT)-like permease